jgi:hypothetical protein
MSCPWAGSLHCCKAAVAGRKSIAFLSLDDDVPTNSMKVPHPL